MCQRGKVFAPDVLTLRPVPMAGRLGSTFQQGRIANTLANRTPPAHGFCTATERDQTLCQAQKQTSSLNEVLSLEISFRHCHRTGTTTAFRFSRGHFWMADRPPWRSSGPTPWRLKKRAPAKHQDRARPRCVLSGSTNNWTST